MARLNARMPLAFGITHRTIAVYTTTDGRHLRKHCRWQLGGLPAPHEAAIGPVLPAPNCPTQ
jgi:hypothetical protein